MSTLRQRHLTMIALGGAIGAGLFIGTGSGIAVAGPGILISFALASGLAVLVMRMLGEMAAAYPSSGAFSVHAEKALGPWAGFSVGWLYWSTQVVVLAVEASGAARIATGWVPAVPQWAWVLAFMGLFTTVNLIGVRSFGEFEFWFAGIKIAAILGFLVIGGLSIFGLLPGKSAVGLDNLTAHGGFLPNGWQGVVAGLLIVVFAFGGIEVVTIAAAESDDPAHSVGRAIRSSVLRIVVFYLGSLTVVVTLLPWNDAAVGSSPYVAVLDRIGIPAAGQLMSAVVFLALLSALNATLYSGSRMIFSLAERGEAPRALRTLSGGVPRRAVLASTTFGFVSVLLNVLWPDTVFLYLLNAVGAVLLLVWALIALSQLRLRRRTERELLVLRMWGFPYLSWATLAGIVGIIAAMATDPEARLQLISAAVLAAVVLACSALRTTLPTRVD